jgi:hypothetical protein
MTCIRLRRAAVLGAAVLGMLSCSRPAPLDPHPAGSLLGPSGLLTCSPLPADSVTQAIGPDGGTLQVGGYRLTVPPGALATPVSITAIAPTGDVNQVRFYPEGLVFQTPASLTMGYANCDLLGSLLPKQIAYTSDALAILDYLPSIDDMLGQQVTARLQHFSTYAIAW